MLAVLLAGAVLCLWLLNKPAGEPRSVPIGTGVQPEEGGPSLAGSPRTVPVSKPPPSAPAGVLIQVLEQQGAVTRPLASALVTVLVREPKLGVLIAAEDLVQSTQTTDARGECPMEAPPAGAWVLTQGKGFAPSVTQVAEGADVHQVVLKPLFGEIGGVVVDTAGRPVRGARVVVCPASHSTAIHEHQSKNELEVPAIGYVSVSTDVDGRFRAPVAVDGGNVRVDVLADGHVAARRFPMPEGSPSIARVVAAPGDVGLRLSVQRVCMFLIRVLNKKTGAPLQARAVVTPIDRTGPLKDAVLLHEQVLFNGKWQVSNVGVGTEWTRPDWDPSLLTGFFRVPAHTGPLPSSVKLLVSVPGFKAVATDVRLYEPGELALWTTLSMEWVSQDPARSVRIAVKHEYPAAVWKPTRLRLLIPGFGFHQLTTVGSARAGTAEYLFENVPDRDVKAIVTDGVASHEVLLRCGVHAGYEVSLVPTALTIALRDPDGVPLYGAVAWLLPANSTDQRFRHFLLPGVTTPHSCGGRVAQAVPPGQWTVHVVKWGYQAVEQPVEVRAGQVTPIELTLLPAKP